MTEHRTTINGTPFEMVEVTEPAVYLYLNGQPVVDPSGQRLRLGSVEEAQRVIDNWVY